MSRRKEKIDPNQMQFDFNFEERVEQYITAREQITDAIENGPTVLKFESEMEISIEIAAEVKRRSGNGAVAVSNWLTKSTAISVEPRTAPNRIRPPVATL